MPKKSRVQLALEDRIENLNALLNRAAEFEESHPDADLPGFLEDVALVADIASAFEALDADPGCRAIVLCSEGKNFCAGAQLAGGGQSNVKVESPLESSGPDEPVRHLYDDD